MMDLSFLMAMINPVILCICLISGYVLKHAFDWFSNRYIPLAATCMGLAIAIVTNYPNINAEVVLEGMISGMASTGLYEMLRNLIYKNGKS